ncbi:MAG: nicotinate (nicotinamide) nucleotide adenylyltransferase [Pseudomonadota bacterium]
MSANDLKKQPLKKQKIGILGGTFDPIHNGHIRLAVEAFERCKLDAVWFVPDESPPWKSQTQWDINYRIELLKIALKGFSQFQIERVIPDVNQPSYSAYTLLALRQLHSDIDFFWILGGDAFLQIHRWHETELFQQNCRMIVIERSEYPFNPNQLPVELNILSKKYCTTPNLEISPLGNWCFINADIPNISSTNIRQQLLEGKDVSDWVNNKVLERIKSDTVLALQEDLKN